MFVLYSVKDWFEQSEHENQKILKKKILIKKQKPHLLTKMRLKF